MVGARWSKIVATAAAVAVLLACFAAAVSAEGEEDTGGFGAFRLRGTNGYSILVLAVSKPRFEHGEAIVLASNRDSAVIYLTPATVTATAIEADLGAAGELSVQFQPEGRPERIHAACKDGGAVTFEPGFWVGTIEINGEEGFTTVEQPRAKAIVTPFLNAFCGLSVSGESVSRDLPGARLVARDGGARRARFLQANQNRPGGPLRIEADLEERRGAMTVDRTIEGFYPGAGLRFDPKLRSATLAPPAPFSGSATFHRNAKPANRWAGNLTVDFPGRAGVPMAGRAFKSTLAHARYFQENHLEKRLARPNLREWLAPAR